MFDITVLIQKVFLLAILVLVGIMLKKFKIADGSNTKFLADLVIYVGQPTLIIYGFLNVKLNSYVLLTSFYVLIAAIIFHAIFIIISICMYRRVPEKKQTILRFATIFTNPGFIGIPLIAELMGAENAVYSSIYVFAFNLFAWSYGCYLYTGNKSYISIKKILLNPATIPTYIGIILLVVSTYLKIPTSISPIFTNFVVPIIKDNVLFLLKDLAIILSMIMIGIRIAESNVLSMFADKNIALLIITRLLIIPLGLLCILKGISYINIIPDNIFIVVSNVLIISAATPAASITSIFAEKYDGNAVYAGKVVSSTTLISLITMTIVAFVLTMWF